MDRRRARSKGVNQALAEPMSLPADRAEAESFADLYERTFPRVYAYVCSMLRDTAAAEDVTAQAYERAYRKRRTYRRGRGSADAWVFGIARNAALDELRRQKRTAGLRADPHDEAAPAADEQAESALRRQVLAGALAELDPRERELVALKFMAGLSNTEIARVLGLSESTRLPSCTGQSPSCGRPAVTEPESNGVVEHELGVIDQALESHSATGTDPVERELAELTLALAAQAPEPRPGLDAELRERVDAGFPRAPRLPTARVPALRLPGAGSFTLRRVAPALGVAASLIVALVVAGSLWNEHADTDATSASKAARPAPMKDEVRELLRRSPGQNYSRTAAPAPADQNGFAPGQNRRRVERSAQLTLAAPDDGMEKLGDQVTGVADRYGGFVLNSSLSTGQDAGGGTFELRVRADDLRAALRDLSRLATVRSRSQAGQDVTVRYVSLDDRLQAARAERRGLLRRLERASSGTQAEALRRRLDLSAREISGLALQLKALRAATDYAHVTVTVEDQSGSSIPAGSRDSIGRAFDDALGSLSGSVEILIRLLGVALPLGILGAAGWVGATVLRRRRREAALT